MSPIRRAPGRQSITILRAPTTRDTHGNDRRDWPNAVETVVTGCEVQPMGSQENLVNQDQVLIAWQVVAPLGTDVKATDRVRYNGTVYEVFGHPEDWPGDSRIDYVGIHLTDWNGEA